MAHENQKRRRARRALDKGLWHFVKGAAELALTYLSIAGDWLWNHAYGALRRLVPTGKRFTFRGKTYPYFYRVYNTTWKNERAVEIPIIREELKRYDPEQVLEFGNVWNRYFKHAHDVIDKYERWPGVSNQDVVDFEPKRKYDFVFAVSTLEHVGWDEDKRDPDKTLVALRRLQAALSPKGKMIVTIPMGYNPFFDYLLDQNGVRFDERAALKRVSRWNDWEPATWNEIRRARYDRPYRGANGLLVLTFKPERYAGLRNFRSTVTSTALK